MSKYKEVRAKMEGRGLNVECRMRDIEYRIQDIESGHRIQDTEYRRYQIAVFLSYTDDTLKDITLKNFSDLDVCRHYTMKNQGKTESK